jgi:hypothetical protein
MPVKACFALGAALVAAVVAGCGTAEAGKAGSDLPTYAADATATGTAGVGGSGSADASSTDPSAGAGVGGSGAIGDIGSAGAGSGAESPPPKVDPRLRGLSLVTADVRHLGLVVKPDEDATSLDWTSVALCDDKEHPSERRRVARYQVTAVPPGWTGRLGDGSKPRYDDPTLESAVTAYDSPASAKLAMKEWRDGLASGNPCGIKKGAELFWLRLGDTTERPDRTLPVADNSIWEMVLEEPGKGEVARGFTILQRHDNLLVDVSYGAGDVYDLDDMKRLAATLGRRLAARG